MTNFVIGKRLTLQILTLMDKTFFDYAEMAANLPQDAKADIYQFFGCDKPVTYYVLYNNVTNEGVQADASPVSVFRAVCRGHRRRYTEGGYLYEAASKTGDDGKILPKGKYRYAIMYHRKWGKRDVPVTDVTFDVVGLKRKSTKLPSGVLIANVKFVH